MIRLGVVQIFLTMAISAHNSNPWLQKGAPPQQEVEGR